MEPTKSARMMQVLRIREAALELLRRHGSFIDAAGISGRPVAYSIANLSMVYRTPFQRIPRFPENLKYSVAVDSQRGVLRTENLSYGLDVWSANRKVLNIEWDDSGDVELITFKRGEWEMLIAETLGNP